MADDHDCGGFLDRLRLAWLVFRLRGRRFCAASSVLLCLDSYDDGEIHGIANEVTVFIGDVDGEDVTGLGGGKRYYGEPTAAANGNVRPAVWVVPGAPGEPCNCASQPCAHCPDAA